MVHPGDERNRPSLAEFRGKAINVGDTTLSARRLLALTKPRLALVWQFVGFRAYRDVYENSAVSSVPPYAFSMDMLGPPPDDVLDHEEPAFGAIWLYSDVNGNGRLDRLIHPEIQTRNRLIDSLQHRLDSLTRELERHAEVRNPPEQIKETFFVDRLGTVLQPRGGGMDTLWQGPGIFGPGDWDYAIVLRHRILRKRDPWEEFFAARKRLHEYVRVQRPAPPYAFAVDFQGKARLFPAKGAEERFEEILREATTVHVRLLLTFESNYIHSMRQGWLDYPYTGFDEPGQDWVAGRSRWYFILYLPNRERLSSLLEAQKASAFSIEDMGRLRTGYNLVKCDAQYSCRVLSQTDSIEVELGSNEMYFYPPSEPVRPPVEEFRLSRLPETVLEKYRGSYDYLAYRPISIVPDSEWLWVQVPDAGLFRFLPHDSLRFVSDANGMQIRFFEDSLGSVLKLHLVNKGEQAVALRFREPVEPEFSRTSARTEVLRARSRIPMTEKDLSAFAASFELGADTLKLEAAQGGDSLRLLSPSLWPQSIYPREDSLFFSGAADLEFRFREEYPGRGISHLLYRRPDGEFWLPRVGFMPRMPEVLFPGGALVAEEEVSASSGSGRDLYPMIKGGNRYSCSEDGLFLTPGDGWLETMERTYPGDSISLGEGGEAFHLRVGADIRALYVGSGGDALVFKITGQMGKRVALELDACAGAPKGRIRIRLRGGKSLSAPEDVLAEDHWVFLEAKAKTLSYAPLPIPADPYYIRIEQLKTLEPPLPYAFDAYRIRAVSD